VSEWWPEMIGENRCFDTSKYFIVCANILGSCYGTTGPVSVNPLTGKPYYSSFPTITIRDMVNAHELLRKHLGIQKIKMVIGSSIGAFQAMEWNILKPALFESMVFISASARTSPWAIAISESQRMAIRSDSTFFDESYEAGKEGLKAARSIAMLSYRNFLTYQKTQFDPDPDKIEDFRASSYQIYQGEKLVKRFNAVSYYILLKALDSHNVGRNRKSLEDALQRIEAKTIVIGVKSDILFPVDEQKFVADHIQNSEYVEIDSIYGHDGFLVESETITSIIREKLKLELYEEYS
jgi:homoserine O-acetyltransferase